MNREAVIQILQSALQPDGDKRSIAENTINTFVKSDYASFLSQFAQVMLDTSVHFQSRQMASLVLKKYFHSKNRRIQKVYESNWLSLSEAFRCDFTCMIHINLNIKETAILSNISKIYGSIMRIELANEAKTDIFTSLNNDISKVDYAVGILDSLSYACDQLYEETMFQFDHQKADIYNIGLFYLKQTVPVDRKVLYSSFKCILSSLEIYEDILNTDDLKKQFIYQIFICPKTDAELLEIGIDVINRFVDVYSNLSDDVLTFVCQANLSYFESNKDDVPIQVFEFWKILIDLEKFAIISSFKPALVQNLMMCLTNEELDNNVVSPHRSAVFLLIDIVNKAKITLISDSLYQNFITNKFKSEDVKERAIGNMALGCVCSPGSEDFIYQLMPLVIQSLESPESVFEALFALSQICAHDISVTVEYLPQIVSQVGVLIQDKSKVSVRAVMVYNSIFTSMKFHSLDNVQSIVFYHYSDILSVLINRLDQSAPEDYDTRSVLNATLIELINTCPPTLKNLLDQLDIYLFGKIEATIQHIKSVSINDALVLDDVLCGYIVLIESSLSLKKTFNIESLLDIFFECLNLPKMLVRGEVYIALSKMLSFVSIHLKKFIPFITRDLSCDDTFVLKAALNLISDCAFFLETSFVEFTPLVIPALGNAIASSDVALELKPRIISGLGDISLAIGRSFSPYVSLCCLLVKQISTLNREDDEEYIDSLNKSAIQLFSCLFVSLCDDQEMKNLLNESLESLRIIILSDREGVNVKDALSLISDAINSFGPAMSVQPWMRSYLAKVVKSSTSENKEIAKVLLNEKLNK